MPSTKSWLLPPPVKRLREHLRETRRVVGETQRQITALDDRLARIEARPGVPARPAQTANASRGVNVLPELAAELLEIVVHADAGPDLGDNVDPRHEADPDLPAESAPLRLAAVLNQIPQLETVYRSLAEPGDRELLARVLAFKVLGRRKVRLPLTRERVIEFDDLALSARVAEHTLDLGFRGWQADDYDLTPLGFPIRLRIYLGNIVSTFLLEQYHYEGRQLEVSARPGDVVIDGGGCWGDTALYFADRVGPSGRVFSFEPDPANRRLLEHNVEINPEAGGRVVVRPTALWREPGAVASLTVEGPATRLSPGGNGADVTTETIDGLVEAEEVERVDLIKLDVEGAELDVLAGAERTLRQFRPRLAVAVYHRFPDDLATIPEYIRNLQLGYRFGLSHPSMSPYETMLFGSADGCS